MVVCPRDPGWVHLVELKGCFEESVVPGFHKVTRNPETAQEVA